MAGERYRRYGITQRYGARDSGFGYSKGYNRGEDYGLPAGTPVEADISGTVVEVGQHPQWGRFVRVRDANGYLQQYSHLSRATVKEGEAIDEGQTIGLSGSTGLATGPHLDFMVLDPEGNDIDPRDYRPSAGEPEEEETGTPDFILRGRGVGPPDNGPTVGPGFGGPRLPKPEYEGEVIEWPLPSGRLQRYEARYDVALGENGQPTGRLIFQPIGAPYKAPTEEPRFDPERETRDERLARQAIADKLDAIKSAQADARLKLDEEELAFRKAKADRDFEQAEQHFNATQELNRKIQELNEAKFKWQQEDTRLGRELEEKRTRISEAQVTGYYRPTPTTPFPRVGQQIGSPGLGIPATLARERFEARQPSLPLPPDTLRTQATAPPIAAPATRTTPLTPPPSQLGPPPQGIAAQAPGAQPSEADLIAQAEQIERELLGVR